MSEEMRKEKRKSLGVLKNRAAMLSTTIKVHIVLWLFPQPFNSELQRLTPGKVANSLCLTLQIFSGSTYPENYL